MLYELYKFEYLKEHVYELNKMLVGTGYELIYKEKKGEKSRDSLAIKNSDGKLRNIMQFNQRHGKIESFGAHLICFRDNYVKLLQEQEAKYQETKKYYKDNNIDKYVYYDAGFMIVADNFPGFSFVNKTKHVQPAIIMECILNIINKILKGEII